MYTVFKYPLYPVQLNTSTRYNNANTKAYPDGASDSTYGYLTDSVLGDYGLPVSTFFIIINIKIYKSRGPVGYTVAGQ